MKTHHMTHVEGHASTDSAAWVAELAIIVEKAIKHDRKGKVFV